MDEPGGHHADAINQVLIDDTVRYCLCMESKIHRSREDGICWGHEGGGEWRDIGQRV